MKIFQNIYSDMKDRHLLIPAVALLVALIAIPVLLKQPAEEPAPPPAPAESLQGDLAATPAVLASEEVGIRQYQRRLEVLQRKDPFKQQFVTPPGQTDVSVSVEDESSSVAVSGGEDVVVDDGGTEVIVPDGNGGDSGDDEEVVTKLYTLRVDVKVVVDGQAEILRDVKPTTMLPTPALPVLAYLGTDEAGERASFVLSRETTPIGGDGSCLPDPINCAYVTLAAGEIAEVHSEADGRDYRFKLLKILPVEKGGD